MDNANQVGKHLKTNKRKSERVLTRTKPIIPQIERVRDTMDFEVPFELVFEVTRPGYAVTLDLNFLPPPKTGCCADCSCAVCEFFAGGRTENLVVTTYAYVPGTIQFFKGNIPSTAYVETDPALGQVTVYAHNNEDIVICYVYNICL